MYKKSVGDDARKIPAKYIFRSMQKNPLFHILPVPIMQIIQ